MTIKIVLGSTSETKRNAVLQALQDANFAGEVVCVDAPSGVHPQPVGEEELWKGAHNRALAARAHDPTAYAIGIESGLIKLVDVDEPWWLDRAVITMIAPDGTTCKAVSEHVRMPSDFVAQSRESGFQVTVGQLIAERHGCNRYDPHSFLTEGKVSRQKLIAYVLTLFFLDELPRPGKHVVHIGSVKRFLPIREVAPGIKVALFNLLGDWELAEAAGMELAKLIPKGTEALVMPDGKALALLHVMGRVSGLPTFVARKERKPYMPDPVVSVTLKSITTDRWQELFLGGDDAAKLHGKSVVFVDDVVSTGGTLRALVALAEKIGAHHTVTLAIFTEGKPREDVISLGHLPLF